MYLLLQLILILLLHEVRPSLAQNDEGFEEFQPSEEAMRDFLNQPNGEGNSLFDTPSKDSFTNEAEEELSPASFEKAESPVASLRNDTMEQEVTEGESPVEGNSNVARYVGSQNMTNSYMGTEAKDSAQENMENENPPEENKENEEELQFYAKVYGNKLLPGDIPRNHQELLKTTNEGELEKIEKNINEGEIAGVRQLNKSSGNEEELVKTQENDNTLTNAEGGEFTKNTHGEELIEENEQQEKVEEFSPQAESTENASARGQITRDRSPPKTKAHQVPKPKQKVPKKQRKQKVPKKQRQLARVKDSRTTHTKGSKQLQQETKNKFTAQTREPAALTTKKTAIKSQSSSVILANQIVPYLRVAVPSVQSKPVTPVFNAPFRYYFAAQPQSTQVDYSKANKTVYNQAKAETSQGTKKHLIQSLYEVSAATSQGTKKQIIFKDKKKVSKSKSKQKKQQKSKAQSKKKNKKNKKKRKNNNQAAIKKEKVRKIQECGDYLACLETWFEKYRLRFTPSLNTPEKLRNFFSDVYKSSFMVSFKKEVGKFVGKLSKMHLINWAIIYEYRPNYASWMNVEFLRMPLGMETPVNLKESTVFRRILWLKEQQSELKIKIRGLKNKPAIGAAKRMKIKLFQQKQDFFERSLQRLRSNETIVNTYRNEAPALAVSGFERNSQIWLQCAPTREKTGKTPYTGVYQRMMDVNSYQCVLFAFMKCVHDMEEEDKRQLSSFKRYSKGFASLIQLHYDYGANQNKLLPITNKNEFDFEKLTSAYCESDVATKCLQEDGMTREKSVKFGDKYYCQNYFGCLATCGKECFLRERNLLPDERNRLMDWLEARKKTRAKAEDELWAECCSNPQDCLPLKTQSF